MRALAERLRSAGLRVWFDKWVIKPGDDIYLSIERGLEASRVQVLCLSPDALGSNWVALERSTVLFRDPTNKGRRFVPLLLADCELPDTLRRYKYVDFRKELEAAFDELLEACREDAEKVAPEPKKKPVTPPEKSEPIAVFERKLIGHTGWVNSVAVSPDGTGVVSGDGHPSDSNFEIRIWDFLGGHCRKVIKSNTGLISAVAITPDGSRFLSSSFDKSIRIWDAVSCQEVANMDGHTAEIWSIVVFPDNSRALSGGFDMTLRLWELSSGKCLNTILCGMDNEDRVYGIAIDPTGTKALSGHGDGSIRLWDIETSKCLALLNGHSNWVSTLQITRDGRFVVSGSVDKTIKIWDLEANKCIGTLEGHEDDVTSIAISPDGKMIASTGNVDHTIRL